VFQTINCTYVLIGMLSAQQRPRVAVIGAGVVGLPVAVILTKNKFRPNVTLIAAEFSPNITSDAAGASLRITGNKTSSKDPRQEKWTRVTYHYFFNLLTSTMAKKLGISLTTMYQVFDGHRDHPWWKNLVLGFRDVDDNEKKILNICQDFNAWCFSTLILPCGPYLEWQLEQFKANGGTVIQRKLHSLKEIDGKYDIVVNCTGLGSRELVGDKGMYPVRGQVILLKAPWVKHSYGVEVADEVTYIYPREEGKVLIGGTAQFGNSSKEIDPIDRSGIIARCSSYVPSFAQAEVINEWVGIRPGRKLVRLEMEDLSPDTAVVHNYGHTGQGLVYSIGCAKDSIQLVEEYLEMKHFIKYDIAKL